MISLSFIIFCLYPPPHPPQHPRPPPTPSILSLLPSSSIFSSLSFLPSILPSYPLPTFPSSPFLPFLSFPSPLLSSSPSTSFPPSLPPFPALLPPSLVYDLSHLSFALCFLILCSLPDEDRLGWADDVLPHVLLQEATAVWAPEIRRSRTGIHCI